MGRKLTSLRPDELHKLDRHDQLFEQLCYYLIRCEAERRHIDAVVRGPRDGKDGGRDVRLVVKKHPRILRHEFGGSLTRDEIGDTWFSCKVGKNWEKIVHQDVGATEAHVLEEVHKTNKIFQDVIESVKAKPKPPLLQHLARGGRYVVCINQTDADDLQDPDKKLQGIIDRLQFWMKALGVCDDPDQPSPLADRIEIIGANELTMFIECHHPVVPDNVLDALEVEEISLKSFDDWAQWTRSWSAIESHGNPAYQSDTAREQIIDEIIRKLGDTSERCVHVMGAPGIGKTRVVHHALKRALDQQSLSEQNILYTSNPDRAKNALERGLCDDNPDLVLVVDEVADELNQLQTEFLARSSAGNALIAIGPMRHSLAITRELSPLDNDASLALVRSRFNDDNELSQLLVDKVLSLSEGFPRYVVLLTDALMRDREALDRPSVQSEQWSSAQAVLAGTKYDYGGDREKLRTQAALRAKAMLVVIMEPTLDWDTLDEVFQERLAHAVNVPSWSDIATAAQRCHERGLLRFSKGSARKYVSPHNLARLIVNHFFEGGPDDLGSRLRRYAPDYRERLYQRAETLLASRNALDTLAHAELDRIEALLGESDRFPLDVISQERRIIEFAARCVPERASQVLARIGATDELRSALRYAYKHLVHRRISPNAFAAVEAALFALALREHRSPETFRLNGMSRFWRLLFSPSVHSTHQPFDDRFAILHRRMAEGTEHERTLAIRAAGDAVEAGLVTGASYNSDDTLDGEWPALQGAEFIRAVERIWEQLLTLAAEPTAAVAHAARATIATRIRDGLTYGLDRDKLTALARAVETWSVAERRALAGNLDDMSRMLDQPPDPPGLDALRAGLKPVTFHERLLAQVGTYTPGAYRLDDPQRDDALRDQDLNLAREGLAPPCPVLDELDWLDGEAAVRRGSFAISLGRADDAHKLLDVLEERARRGASRRLLAGYVAGWRARAGDDAVDDWLAKHRNTPGFADVCVYAIALLDGTERRVEWLRSLLSGDEIGDKPLRSLNWGDWTQGISAQALESVIATLAARDDDPAVKTALALSRLLVKREDWIPTEEQAAVMTALVHRGVTLKLQRIAEVGWERVIEYALAHGHAGQVIQALVRLFSQADADASPHIFAAIRMLRDSGHADELWTAMTAQPAATRSFMRLVYNTKLRTNISSRAILAWIGDDVERATSAVVELCSIEDDGFDEVARELITGFGPTSRPAKMVTRKLMLAGSYTPSMKRFYEQQRERVRAWKRDASLAVMRWVEQTESELEQQIARENARQALKSQYG